MCPECRVVTLVPSGGLTQNFYLVSLIEARKRRPKEANSRLRMWCATCGGVALDRCADHRLSHLSHVLQSLTTHFETQHGNTAAMLKRRVREEGEKVREVQETMEELERASSYVREKLEERLERSSLHHATVTSLLMEVNEMKKKSDTKGGRRGPELPLPPSPSSTGPELSGFGSLRPSTGSEGSSLTRSVSCVDSYGSNADKFGCGSDKWSYTLDRYGCGLNRYGSGLEPDWIDTSPDWNDRILVQQSTEVILEITIRINETVRISWKKRLKNRILDAECGSLHCRTPEKASLGPYFYRTKWQSSEDCRSVHANKSYPESAWLVPDGTPCGDGEMCVAQRCVSRPWHLSAIIFLLVVIAFLILVFLLWDHIRYCWERRGGRHTCITHCYYCGTCLDHTCCPCMNKINRLFLSVIPVVKCPSLKLAPKRTNGQANGAVVGAAGAVDAVEGVEGVEGQRTPHNPPGIEADADFDVSVGRLEFLGSEVKGVSFTPVSPPSHAPGSAPGTPLVATPLLHPSIQSAPPHHAPFGPQGDLNKGNFGISTQNFDNPLSYLPHPLPPPPPRITPC
ncbi:hypothetical protein O3P69_019268 [Scylla paramamosain]|uniref:ADAM cysteine-rich domain-containing protein n=1 Tax=Scylla paramamosain TaxID=85552 RepID=A0AAW0SX09_SCYPA